MSEFFRHLETPRTCAELQSSNAKEETLLLSGLLVKTFIKKGNANQDYIVFKKNFTLTFQYLPRLSYKIVKRSEDC